MAEAQGSLSVKSLLLTFVIGTKPVDFECGITCAIGIIRELQCFANCFSAFMPFGTMCIPRFFYQIRAEYPLV